MPRKTDLTGPSISGVREILNGNSSNWGIDQLRALIPKFRGGHGGVFGDGLVMCPKDVALWSDLKKRLL